MVVVTDFSAADGDKIRINVDDPDAREFSQSGLGSVANALWEADNLIYRVVDDWEEAVPEPKLLQYKGQSYLRSAHDEFHNYNDGNRYVSSTNDKSQQDTIIYYGNGQKIAMVLEDFGGGIGDDLVNHYYESPVHFLDFV